MCVGFCHFCCVTEPREVFCNGSHEDILITSSTIPGAQVLQPEVGDQLHLHLSPNTRTCSSSLAGCPQTARTSFLYPQRQVSRQSCHLPTLSLTKGMKTCKYSSPTASSLERFCGVPHRSPELSCKTESCCPHLL